MIIDAENACLPPLEPSEEQKRKVEMMKSKHENAIKLEKACRKQIKSSRKVKNNRKFDDI